MKNLILNTDSYKLSHAPLYPSGIQGMSSYIEARAPNEWITFFGLQMFLKKYLTQAISLDDIQEAEEFAKTHGEPFNRTPWDYILSHYNGYLPIQISAVPEGTRVPSQNILLRVDCEDPKVFWLAMYIETALQRSIWYPSTIASNDYKNWRILRRYWAETVDREWDGFQLHDFGARGVSSEESAQIGGAAHLVYFNGSDTISGTRAANKYYNSSMSAFSIPATEHSIQCAWGPIYQKEYLDHVLNTYAKPGAIVSIVIDGYDVYRETQELCYAKQKIIDSGARIVFRPDSGNPLQVIPRILRLQEEAFGAKTNSKGFKVINNVGIIQGDGIDLETMEDILKTTTGLGYSSENLVFGSGGALLQKVNRDTYGFAQKASAVKRYNHWEGIQKVTPGKKSKAGRLVLLQNRMTDEYMTVASTNKASDTEWKQILRPVFDTGKLLIDESLDEIRERARK